MKASASDDREQALDGGEAERRELLRAQRRLEQPDGRGRDGQHDGDQQRADGVERDHDRDRHRDQQHAIRARRAHADGAGAVGIEAGSEPRAAHRAVRRQRRDRGGRGQPQIQRRERDQRAEQQPVDARAGLVDVAGQDHADRQRRHEQQPDRGVGVDPARPLDPLEHAAEADRARQRGELRRHAPRPGDDEPGERRGADRVRVERQPPQHDPRAEDAGDDRQQQHLDDAALDVGGAEVRHRARTPRGGR